MFCLLASFFYNSLILWPASHFAPYIRFLVIFSALAFAPVYVNISLLAAKGCRPEQRGEACRLRATVRPQVKSLAPTLHPTNFSIM